MSKPGRIVSAVVAAIVLVGTVTITTLARAAAGCQVAYSVTNSWQGGFGASVTITNLGDPVAGWRLTWAFTAGQVITQLWNGTLSGTGPSYTVTNASFNGTLGAGATASFGFLANGTPATPTISCTSP